MTEQQYEIFEPGDLVQFRPTERFAPRHVFVVIVGGYMTRGEWRPIITEKPLTTKDFMKVGHLD